jgi:hypothetical protein
VLGEQRFVSSASVDEAKATASETNGSVEHFARQKVQRLNAIVIGCDSEDSEGRNARLTVIGYGVGRGVRADCAVSSTQRRSISNPIKRGRETEAQHSTAQHNVAQRRQCNL